MKNDSKIKKVASGHVNGREMVHDLNPSIGNIAGKPYPATKTSGIRVRGGKAQTKGFMARGPMG